MFKYSGSIRFQYAKSDPNSIGVEQGPFGSRLQARYEGRNAPRIFGISPPEFDLHLSLFAFSQTHIHPNQHRKHHSRRNRRPLQQETKHDRDECGILRMPHV